MTELKTEDLTLSDVQRLNIQLPFGTSIIRVIDAGEVEIRICCGVYWTSTSTGQTSTLSDLVEEEELFPLSQFAGWEPWSVMEIPPDRGWNLRMRETLDDIRCDLLDSRIVTLADANNDNDTELTPCLLVKALIAKHTALKMRLKA